MRSQHHNLSDAEIVRRTLAGSRSSFDTLVDRYRDRVYRLAYFKVRRPDEAEDLAQDAFVAAYQSLGQLREYDRFAPWLRRVAENVCNMRLRRSQPETIPLEDYHTPTDGHNIERWLLDTRIHDALSQLSETNRLAATLFFVDGLSQKEIAEFLDVPVTTVKRRINLSRARLKKELLDIMHDTIGPEKAKPEFTDEVAARIDVLRWCRQFGDYINAGVSLGRALLDLEEGDFSDRIKEETHAVRTAIMEGALLTKAIREHSPLLNHPLIVGMLRAGEIGGVLDQSLNTIVSWMEREDIGLKVDAAYWLRTLAMMLTAGVPVVQAIDTMQHVRAAEPLPELQARLNESIRKGGRFPHIFAEFPVLFSPAVIALITAGEENGMLDTALVLAASEILREVFEKIQSDTALAIEPSQREKLAEQVRAHLADKSPESRVGALQALDQLTGAVRIVQVDPLTSRRAPTRDELTGSESMLCYVSALDDRSAEVRRAAAEILGKHPPAESVTALSGAVKDKSPEVRQAALVSLSSINPEAGYEQAKSMLGDKSVAVRRAAIRILGSSNRAESAGLLVGQLADGDMLIEREAMDALIRIGKLAVEPLVNAMSAPKPSSCQSAMETLTEIDPGRAREVALDLLHRGITDARSAAIRTIAKISDPEDIPILIEALTDESPMVRVEATRSLARLGHKESSDAIIGCLQDPAPSVRSAAIQALVDLGAESATPAVAQMIGDLDQHTATTAIKALESMGQLVERALSCLSHEDELVRIRAAHILRYNPTPEAADALIRALDDEAFMVGVISALALANIGRNEALPKLIQLLESPYHSEEAAKALAQLGYSAAAPHIRKAIQMGTLADSLLWTAEKLEGDSP